MKTGPKYKIAKRLGGFVFEKTQTPKFALSEARGSGKKWKFGRSRSEFARQLLERQRTRFTYNITAAQLDRYLDRAMQKSEKAPVAALYRLLESRLDNVVYRLGLAPSRQAARQMVSHGHIDVNGRRLSIPSHQVSVGDSVSVRPRSRGSTLFQDLEERTKDRTVPSWLTFDGKGGLGKVVGVPETEKGSLPFDLSAVIEFAGR